MMYATTAAISNTIATILTFFNGAKKIYSADIYS